MFILECNPALVYSAVHALQSQKYYVHCPTCYRTGLIFCTALLYTTVSYAAPYPILRSSSSSDIQLLTLQGELDVSSEMYGPSYDASGMVGGLSSAWIAPPFPGVEVCTLTSFKNPHHVSRRVVPHTRQHPAHTHNRTVRT
jgi:hypothetical protein